MDSPTRKNVETNFLARKGAYEETFYFGKRTLHRSFNWGHLWTPGKDGTGTAFTQITVSQLEIPVKNRKRKLLDNYGTPKKKNNLAIKDKISLENKRFSYTMCCALPVLAIGALALIIPFFFNNNTDSRFDFYLPMLRELPSVQGQENAVERLVGAFTNAINRHDSPVMVFTGPVGVGKSFTASILRQYFPWKNNVYFATCDSLPSRQEPYTWSKGDRLYIIEDCSLKSENSIIEMSKKVNDLLRRNEDFIEFFVIIFTTNAVDNIFKIRELLEPQLNGIQKEIEFKPLERKVVEHCFLTFLKAQGLRIPDADFVNLVDEHMAPIEPFNGNQGCKNIETKLLNYRSKNGV